MQLTLTTNELAIQMHERELLLRGRIGSKTTYTGNVYIFKHEHYAYANKYVRIRTYINNSCLQTTLIIITWQDRQATVYYTKLALVEVLHPPKARTETEASAL